MTPVIPPVPRDVQIERSVRDTAEWAISVQVSLPVFSLNGGAIKTAEARSHQVTAERQRLATGTLNEIDAALELAKATGVRASLLAQRLPSLEKAVTELVAQAGNAAAGDPVKLLLIQERHGHAHRAILAAALEHRLALIALAALTEAGR